MTILDCRHYDTHTTDICPCSDRCPCRVYLRCVDPQKQKIPSAASPDSFGGSDYDNGFESGWQRQMYDNLLDGVCAPSGTDSGVVNGNALTDSHTQPPPEPNDLPFVKDLVAQDLVDRAAFGYSKYGTYLQPSNGRDTLKDIYQEQLDALIYIRSLIFERDGK